MRLLRRLVGIDDVRERRLHRVLAARVDEKVDRVERETEHVEQRLELLERRAALLRRRARA